MPSVHKANALLLSYTPVYFFFKLKSVEFVHWQFHTRVMCSCFTPLTTFPSPSPPSSLHISFLLSWQLLLRLCSCCTLRGVSLSSLGWPWVYSAAQAGVELFWFSWLSFMRNWDGRRGPWGLTQSVDAVGLQLLQSVSTLLSSSMAMEGPLRVWECMWNCFDRTESRGVGSLTFSCLQHLIVYQSGKVTPKPIETTLSY